jgi:putative transposase
LKVVQAFRFELDPNDRERGQLASHAGAARFAWNWGLERCKRALDQGERVPSAPELHREWNTWKRENAPWWVEVSKCAPQEAFRDLAAGFKAFFGSRSGKRKGPKVRFPKFKKKYGCRDAFRLTGAVRAEAGARVHLPRLKRLRTKESTRKLVERVEGGRCRILSATVSRQAERWFVSFTVENHREDPVAPGPSGSVGIDLGVSCFAVLSNGERIESPRPLERSLRKLRRLSKAHTRKEKGSCNRKRSARRLSRLHAKIANQRSDWLHKVTTRLAKSHGRIVVEDLAVANLIRNRRLARQIADQGWGEFRRQLGYKTAWYGSELVAADRYWPSTKRCSACGNLKEVSLDERTYRCARQGCGLVLDRDLNAARNLVSYPETVAVSEPETLNACGEGSAGQPVRPGGTALREAGTVRVGAPRGARGKGRESASVTEVTLS